MIGCQSKDDQNVVTGLCWSHVRLNKTTLASKDSMIFAPLAEFSGCILTLMPWNVWSRPENCVFCREEGGDKIDGSGTKTRKERL